MTLNDVIEFCKTNGFEDYKENLSDYQEEGGKELLSSLSEEEQEAIKMTIEASKNLEFLYVKHFDSFELSIYRTNELTEEIEFTMQMLFITSSGNTIPQGINFNKETLETLTEDEITNYSGKMVFKILAEYGKMVGFKILQTRKQIKENQSKAN